MTLRGTEAFAIEVLAEVLQMLRKIAVIGLFGVAGLMASGVASSAWGSDIYVDNQIGDDHREGRSPESTGEIYGPVATIGRAVKLAQPGDRIVLANTGQPYRECVTIQGYYKSGFGPDYPFTIEGNGATLDGSVVIDDSDWEGVAGDLWRVRPKRMSYQVLLLDGQPAKRIPVARGAKTLPDLQPLEWCLIDGYIYFRVEPNRWPGNYAPACAGHPVGITIYDARHVLIRGLTVRGFALDGINAADKAFEVKLDEVLTRDNGRSGIAVCGASRVTVANSVSEFNHESQLHVEGWCHVKLNGTELNPETAPAIDKAQSAEILGEPLPPKK
jgi:hypothetical protein